MRADAQRNRAAILAAAEAVFAQRGADAPTDEIAGRAGVAIGTVFRHFPTKRDLQQAVMKDVLHRLIEHAERLSRDGDPATALREFVEHMVAQTSATRTIAEALDITEVPASLATLREGVGRLVADGQRAGSIRPAVRDDEVMALLACLCHGAMDAGWSDDLRRRTLATVFAGLTTAPGRPAP